MKATLNSAQLIARIAGNRDRVVDLAHRGSSVM
jgi:hypothetical protein